MGAQIGAMGPAINMGPLAALELAASMEPDIDRQDRQQSELGWVLYCAGWALCICCGPVGPAFWFGVACRHWCRPKIVRDQLPREHAVAVVALSTAVIGIIIVLMLAVGFLAAKHKHESETDYSGSYGHRKGHW